MTVHTFSVQIYRSTGSITVASETLSWPGELPIASRLVIDVFWVSADALLVREVDRASRHGQVIVFQNGAKEGRTVRVLGKAGEQGDDGWIDMRSTIIPYTSRDGSVSGYLNIVPNQGYNHVALFSPVDATEPTWISSGEWEVTELNGINKASGTLFFTAAKPAIDRHIFSAKLPTSDAALADPVDVQQLTGTEAAGYNTISLSPGGGFYALQYLGPDIPRQHIVSVAKVFDDILLEDNQALNKTVATFQRAVSSQITIKNDGNGKSSL